MIVPGRDSVRDSDCDRGSVVVVALVVMLLGGIAVSAISSFDIAVTRARVVQDRRVNLESTADSTVAFESSRVRRRSTDPGLDCPVPIPAGSGPSITISCSPKGGAAQVVASGLVTTLNSSTLAAQTLPTWAGSVSDAIQGAVVINTGTLATPSISYLRDRRTVSAGGTTPTWESSATAWSSMAASRDITSPGTYPLLPPIPTYERPGSQTTIGSCNVYFPGRYLGSSTLTLSGGLHYFVSGDYYFERILAVTNGARVVMGSGRYPGCTDDSVAASTSRSPRPHEISGRGATILLGGTARIVVQESSFIINGRDGAASVRTVEFGTSTSSIVIPADSVRLANGTIVPAASHSVLPPGSSTPVSYKASTLASTSAYALDIRLNGSNPQTNQVVLEGQVFLPHAGLRATSTTSTYALSLSGGIVATQLTTSLAAAPSGDGSSYYLGVALPQSTGTLVTIEAVASEDGHALSSTAVYDVQGSAWNLVGRSHRYSSPNR